MPESATSSIFNRLYGLYELQDIDSTLDELNETHGDLPKELNECRDLYTALAEKINRHTRAADEAAAKRIALTGQIADALEREKKYKEQQYAVTSNRQYDALAREMEGVQTQIAQLRNSFKPLELEENTAREAAAALAPELETLRDELSTKELELEESKLTTNEEEAQLRKRRQEAMSLITGDDMAMYEKIRTARGGQAIALVKRDSCSGCFNMVPPQKSVELRKFSAIITCEYCGRILVPEELLQKNIIA